MSILGFIVDEDALIAKLSEDFVLEAKRDFVVVLVAKLIERGYEIQLPVSQQETIDVFHSILEQADVVWRGSDEPTRRTLQ